VQTTYYKRYNC